METEESEGPILSLACLMALGMAAGGTEPSSCIVP